MKNRSKRLLALLMAAIMSVGLMACGGGSSAPAAAPAAEAKEEKADAAAPAAEAEAAGDIVKGGNLTLRRTGTTPINPTQTIAPEGDSMTYLLFFETLTWNNEADFTPQPFLAESWQWAEDNLSLEMKIKEGVNFFDGTAVNAEAVKATFEFYKDPDTAHSQASYLENLDSVEVVDEYTAKFVFSAPDSGFLNAVSQPIGIILAPAAIEKFKAEGDPEVFAREGGCGPFVLDTFKDGESLLAVKNENYYGVDENGEALPYLDSVTVQIIGDEAVMDANMNSGDIDVVDFFYNQNYIEDFRDNDEIVLYPIATNTNYILYLNMSKAPFDDIKVRQAICYAFDREELIDVMAGGEGYQVPGIVLPSQTFYRDGKIYGYEPETSKALLAEAGYPDGVDVDFYFGTYGQNQQIAELLQAQAAAAGFNITLQPTDGASVKQLWASYNPDTPAGFRMNELGHPKATPYVQMDYTFGQNALQNSAKWFDDELADLLQQIRTTTDQAERDKVLVRIQEMAEEQIPIVGLHSTYKYSAYQNWVEGLRYNGGGTMTFTNAWLNK